MDDLPYKPGKSPQELEEGARREWEVELKKRESADKRRLTRVRNAKKSTSTRRGSPATQSRTGKTKRPVKSLPPMAGQPRDHLGRFARKAGAVLWGATKATGRVIKATVKGVKSAHKTVKRVNAAARRRDRLAERERAVRLREREKKLGKTRRRKR